MYTMLIIYLLISVGISFLCSIMEAVYLSTSESFVRSHQDKTDTFSKDLLKYAGLRKGVTISAILTLNTFAHTIGASGVGAEATNLFKRYGINEDLGLTITSIVLTLVILIFSEIIPKQLGNKHWKSLVGIVIKITKPMIIILSPILFLLKVIGLNKDDHGSSSDISREEISTVSDMGVDSGSLTKMEGEILKSFLKAHKSKLEDIMVPIVSVNTIKEESTLREFANQDFEHMRIPCYGNDVNDIKGYINKSELLETIVDSPEKENDKVSTLLREIPMVNDKTPIKEVLKILINQNSHIAIIQNKFATTLGVVTIEDIIELYFNVEIMDEFDVIVDHQTELLNQLTIQDKINRKKDK